MKALFRSLTIKTKLNLILGIVISSLILIQLISLNELWYDLNNNKKDELKQLSQVAHSIISKQDQLVLSGKITESQAKSTAKSLISELSYGNNEYYFIFDNQYRMVMHPIKPSLNGTDLRALTDANGFAFFTKMIEKAITTDESYINYVWPRPGSERAIDKATYSIYYPKWGWGVATGVYIDDLVDKFHDEVIQMLQLTVGIIVIALLIILYTADSIITPLVELENKMLAVTKLKDLTIRANIGGNDEVADMSNAFDTMLEEFHNILSSMSLASEQISCSSTELSANTIQTLNGMESQKSETHQVATAMTEMSATVNQVAVNITDAAQASHEAAQASDTCRTVMENSNNSITQLAHKIGQAETLIHTLETQSNDISSILSVISDIAEQTNLLALNAAIEAARAGEMGRGFAVVADEVRSLSSRTHESTNEIHNVINNLQQGAKSAVTAMIESKQAAAIAVESASQTDKALLNITEAVAKIDIMTTEIASASEEQTVVADEINRNINNISDISDESASASAQTAVASEELATLAVDLKTAVQQFKVNDHPALNISVDALSEEPALNAFNHIKACKS